MMDWDNLWYQTTLRFDVGEMALFIGDWPEFHGTPVEVIERGPFHCRNCGGIHDYAIRTCTGRDVVCLDSHLKKLPPPDPDEVQETDEELTDELHA